MSIQNEIDRITAAVANTYAVLEGYGATMPESQGADNLAATAATVMENSLRIAAATGDGASYSATIPGITALKKGIVITIIPDTTSTATIPTLNVNGLGTKNIKQRLSVNTSLTAAAVRESWMVANKPVSLMYDGSVWATVTPRASASDLYGTVPVANGGVPTPTDDDEGKVLCVASGVPAWTDRAAIVSDVLAALPVWEGGSY